MNFIELLTSATQMRQSPLCIGLDPNPDIFVEYGLNNATKIALVHSIETFCTNIIDATADYACAFKLQVAYFSAYRAESVLERIIAYIHQKHQGIPVILDAKRGDIGVTAGQYAKEAFERYAADAVTVQPYLGFDAIAPYLRYSNKGVFVLCHTSNPSSIEVQDLDVGGEALYQRIARLVKQWNAESGQLGLVVGATFPKQLASVRAIVGEMPLLIPGIGAQGADLNSTVHAGKFKRSLSSSTYSGLLISVSRAILEAEKSPHYAQAARCVAQRLSDQLHDQMQI